MLISAMDVVIVEDSDTLREEMRVFLIDQGFEVRAFADGREMDLCLLERAPDLVVLDLNLPGEDGLSIARRLRQRWPTLGIIMLTARAAAPQRAEGYGVGADVYLTKPASLVELRAAMSSLGRRLERQNLQSWCLDLAHAVVRGPQGSARLTTMEMDVLRALALAPQRELDNAQLFDCLQRTRDIDISRNALSICMSRLRSKLREELGAPDCLKAVRGHGYRLTVAMTVVG